MKVNCFGNGILFFKNLLTGDTTSPTISLWFCESKRGERRRDSFWSVDEKKGYIVLSSSETEVVVQRFAAITIELYIHPDEGGFEQSTIEELCLLPAVFFLSNSDCLRSEEVGFAPDDSELSNRWYEPMETMISSEDKWPITYLDSLKVPS